jgi:hypothetical protein
MLTRAWQWLGAAYRPCERHDAAAKLVILPETRLPVLGRLCQRCARQADAELEAYYAGMRYGAAQAVRVLDPLRCDQ